MSNARKHHSPEEKVAILRRHLIDKVPVSTLCDEHLVPAENLVGLNPLMFAGSHC